MEDQVEQVAEEPFLSNLDIVILLAAIALGIYYYYSRKQSPEFDASTIKSFTIEPSLQRQGSNSQHGFFQKMKASGRNVVVFYGSQTGTAEEFAARLAKDANRYAMKAMVADPEECDMEELTNLSSISSSIAIFCMATYGEGDPTDNAQEFFEWLQNASADLSGLNFAVFGLGNKTYEHFNEMAIFVDKKLTELGATRIVEAGMGDDDANIEEDFITWKEKLWANVCDQFNVELSGEDINLRQYELKIHDPEDLPHEKVFSGEVARLNSYKNQKPPYDAKNPFLAPITTIRELYKGPRSCMHIEMDIGASKLRFESGDHVAVYPRNDTDLVEKLGQLLNTNLDTIITLRNLDEDSSKKTPFPCPCSYRTALSFYVDILHTPRTNVLKELAEYALDETHKEKLKTMSSSSDEGKAMYSDWIIRSCRSIVHVLEDLPSVKPPMDHLLELLPRLQSRYYSISNSPKLDPATIHITAVLIEYQTPAGHVNKGVCTSWLKTKAPGTENDHPLERVPIFIRRSQFKLPAKPQTPIIMIGPGTGFAPFRGFLQERRWMKSQGKPVGDNILYFGCRKQDEDYLYKEELAEYKADGTLSALYTAFSRDQAEKIYVTHLMRQNKQELWDVIGERNGHVYVCGDARSMAKDVRDILLEVIAEQGARSKSDAEAYFKKMESQRRYSADVWS